jgi:hypothetical protein
MRRISASQTKGDCDSSGERHREQYLHRRAVKVETDKPAHEED